MLEKKGVLIELDKQEESFKISLTRLIVLFPFIIGGSLQFFIGLSNTLTTLLLSVFILIFINHRQITYLQLRINYKIAIGLSLPLTLILTSGISNHSDLKLIIIYSFYLFIPLILTKLLQLHYSSNNVFRKTFKVILIITVIQLPVLVIQYYFYDTIILFNNSHQEISKIDFQFGTFLLKNDHSLGFFLLSVLISIYFNAGLVHSKSKKLLFTIIIIISVAMTNSSTSYLLLAVSLYIVVLIHLPKPVIRIILIFTGLFTFLSILYIYSNSEMLLEFLGLNQKNDQFIEDGSANRFQIIYQLLTHKPSILGEGPYSYFNVITGQFKSTKNFSQWIWMYFDIGIVGLFSYILYLIVLFINVCESNSKSWILFSFFMFYGFFTTIGMDLAFIIILFLFNIKWSNESYNSTISRP